MLRLSLVSSHKICIIFLRTVVKIWRFFACPYNFDPQCISYYAKLEYHIVSIIELMSKGGRSGKKERETLLKGTTETT